MGSTVSKAGESRRPTPTERQVESARKLGDKELVGLALAALHALNRRAKEKRDRARLYRRPVDEHNLPRGPSRM